MDALHKLLVPLIAVCIFSATPTNATMDNTPPPKPYKSPPPPADPPLPFSNIPVLVWPPFLRNKSPPHRVYESPDIDRTPVHTQPKNPPTSKPPTYHTIPINPNNYLLPSDSKTYPIPMYIPPKYSPPKPTTTNPTVIYIPPTSPFKPTKSPLSPPLKYKSPPPHVVAEPQPFPQDPPPQYTSSFSTHLHHHHKFPPPSD